ncbi:MAG TPA: ATP-binding cassette domain-containing protein [Aggregatilineaceae bacterium]|nr:ATP-binding cassette domain-containing protein [Aggregatilineaceae bacterium]
MSEIAAREEYTGAAAAEDTPLLELRDMCKWYGPVEALCNMDFTINRREIIGLLGDNGAGKSTLIKLMSGIVQADSGTILANGREVQLNSRRDSEQLGIETIYQDTALVDTMSVTRNVFMGREITNRLGFMRHRKMRQTTLEVLGQAVHIGGIDDPDKVVGELSGGQKQAVAIARAVYFKRLILLLDEPTSALAVRASERLLAYIRELKDEGVSSVLVTHNLYHAFQVCDRFVVMSHGQKVLDIPKQETSLEELTAAVVLT